MCEDVHDRCEDIRACCDITDLPSWAWGGLDWYKCHSSQVSCVDGDECPEDDGWCGTNMSIEQWFHAHDLGSCRAWWTAGGECNV